MSQSEGPRIVAKYVDACHVKFDADGDPIKYSFGDTSSSSGWTIADTTTGVVQWRGYIDLSGYRPDDMVLVPSAVQCQYGSNWFSTSSPLLGPGGSAYIQYALTTDKIDDLDFGTLGISEPLAGYIDDNSEMDQVVYGCSEFWTPTASGGGLQNAQKMEYGDGVPIVGPRLYIAIRVQLQPKGNPSSSYAPVDTEWNIPPMRFVIVGNATEVPEFQLLHLMKRQIDLQQTPDVDV